MSIMRSLVLVQQRYTFNTYYMRTIFYFLLTSLICNVQLSAQNKPCTDTLTINDIFQSAQEDESLSVTMFDQEKKTISCKNLHQLLYVEEITLKTINKEQYIFTGDLIESLRYRKDSILSCQIKESNLSDHACIDLSFPFLKKRKTLFAKVERTQLETRQQVVTDSIRIVKAALDRENKMVENAKNDHEANKEIYQENKNSFYTKYSVHEGQIDKLFEQNAIIDNMLADFKAGKSLSAKDREKIVEVTNTILDIKNQVNNESPGFISEYDQLNNTGIRLQSFLANVTTLKKMIKTSKKTLVRFDDELVWIKRRLTKI